jgi:hypothetical protein
VDCLIRNISPIGALIRLSGAVTVPEEFELLIPKQTRHLRARIAWRRQDECGIRFVTQDSSGLSPAFSLQFKRLEEEKDALKARIAELTASF